ncbi:hypothetical protein, partial [Brevibacillus sp. SIMBA_040]|uniref:hypothetical protein n=1 Tax=Brevibacillus sp. SIMBA_040 TaxID=3085781 RepID=UPI00397C7C69
SPATGIKRPTQAPRFRVNATRIPESPTPVIIGSRTATLKGNSLRAANEATDVPAVAPTNLPGAGTSA